MVVAAVPVGVRPSGGSDVLANGTVVEALMAVAVVPVGGQPSSGSDTHLRSAGATVVRALVVAKGGGSGGGALIRMMATEALGGGILEEAAATSYGEFDGMRKMVAVRQARFAVHYGCSGVRGFGWRRWTADIAVGSRWWLSYVELEMVQQWVACTSSVSPLPPSCLDG
uniref:Uncharacterized protein n=1 Tax=Oryza punctata TaxID=4537 RepID=A0A0E0LB90_ORYPU